MKLNQFFQFKYVNVISSLIYCWNNGQTYKPEFNTNAHVFGFGSVRAFQRLTKDRQRYYSFSPLRDTKVHNITGVKGYYMAVLGTNTYLFIEDIAPWGSFL